MLQVRCLKAPRVYMQNHERCCFIVSLQAQLQYSVLLNRIQTGLLTVFWVRKGGWETNSYVKTLNSQQSYDSIRKLNNISLQVETKLSITVTVFGSLILTATDSFPIVFLGLVSIAEHTLSAQCLTLIPNTAFVKNTSLRFVLVGGNLVKHPRSLMSDIFQEKGVHTVLGM